MRPPAAPADRRLETGSVLRAAGPALVGWVVGLVVTALVAWSPHVLFGYRSPSLHLVLDSVDACVALLVAYLLHGRFVRRGRLQDLLLAQGLVVLAVAGIGLDHLGERLDGGRDGTLDVWLPLTVRAAGALLIAAAAFAGPSRDAPSSAGRWTVGVPTGVVAVTSLALWVGRSRLPLALDQSGAAAVAQPLILAGHPLLLLVQGTTAVCFFAASVMFTTQAVGRADVLFRSLGAACALAAFARVNYVLFPTLYTDWFYTGDLLRTGFYLLLLVGAAREIQQYWSAQSRAAVLEDRRRLARELHDGVIQELALIRMEGHDLPDVPARSRILAACDRALDEARAAVQALGHSGNEPLGFLLHRTTRELAQRYRVDLEVDLDDSVDATQEQRHALLRIAREAVSNAVRHGRAGRIRLQLSRAGERRRLTIEDDGEGFDVAAVATTGAGYGLISMRDRADGLPGSLEMHSEPGRGSTVTVAW